MEMREDRQSGVLVVTPRGRIDSTTSHELQRRLLQHLGAGDTRLVIDMQGVEYISSAGLRVLLMLLSRLRQAEGHLVLCSLGESVRQVFELAGFIPIFALEASRELALARIGAAG